MSASRLSTLLIAVVLVAIVVFTAQQAISNANPTYRESKDQALREYSLGERYGGLPEGSTLFSVERIRREYVLGERYGALPQEYTHQQALREYWLGERYGQTP
jgi:ABC-type siderophore export system fused ATPase/permease subunit